MRRLSSVGAAIACVSVYAVWTPSAQSPDVGPVLASVRQALGGDAALTAVTSFTMSGNQNRTIAQFTNSESLEISCVLPDKFLQLTRRSIQDPRGSFTMSRFTGFNGQEAILETVAPGAPFPVTIPGPQPTTPDEIAAARARRLNTSKRLFVRLTLPLFAASFPSYPLSFQSAGSVSLAGGQAHVIEARGPDGFTWRLFIDAATNLPVKLAWMDKPIVTASTSSIVKVGPRGQVGAAERMEGLPPGDPTASLAAVEWEMAIGDYRTGDGLNWPRRLTLSFAGQRHEEIRIGRIRINPIIDPKVFAPRSER